jgi:hypothetical protein
MRCKRTQDFILSNLSRGISKHFSKARPMQRRFRGSKAGTEAEGIGNACAEAWWRWRMRRNLLEVAHPLKFGVSGACVVV